MKSFREHFSSALPSAASKVVFAVALVESTLLVPFLISVATSGMGMLDWMAGRHSNYAVVEMFFATDRRIDSNAALKGRFTNERGVLAYGVAKVSVPAHHKMGELERPTSFLRWEVRKEDPQKHIVLLSADMMSQRDYYDALRKRMSERAKRAAFIFVHGYNVSFELAALRTGQMAYDLGFKGVPLFYSWPSQGNLAKYPVDETNVDWAEANLRIFFDQFAKDSSAEEIYVIAHSMGSRAATKALLAVLTTQPELRGRYKELVLAAPDIDAEVFRRDIVTGFAKLSAPVTLYANSGDYALLASQEWHGSPRAGASGRSIVVAPGLETVDATLVGTSVLGHSEFVENRLLLTDLTLLLEQRLRADRRPGLDTVRYDPLPYWRFRR